MTRGSFPHVGLNKERFYSRLPTKMKTNKQDVEILDDDDDDDDDNNDNNNNHNYNKILKSDWFSTALISALIGQYAPSRARLNGFFVFIASEKIVEFLVF